MGQARRARRWADEAVVILGRNGHFEDASPAALEVLGLSLRDLRGRSPRELMAMDEAASEALSETWKAPVPKVGAGEATVRRPDGSAVRVRFLLKTLRAGRYEVVFVRLSAPPTDSFVVYSLPELLSRWRAAERELAEATPGTAEWATLRSAIDAFRRQYQSLHESKRREHATARNGHEARALPPLSPDVTSFQR